MVLNVLADQMTSSRTARSMKLWPNWISRSRFDELRRTLDQIVHKYCRCNSVMNTVGKLTIGKTIATSAGDPRPVSKVRQTAWHGKLREPKDTLLRGLALVVNGSK